MDDVIKEVNVLTFLGKLRLARRHKTMSENCCLRSLRMEDGQSLSCQNLFWSPQILSLSLEAKQNKNASFFSGFQVTWKRVEGHLNVSLRVSYENVKREVMLERAALTIIKANINLHHRWMLKWPFQNPSVMRARATQLNDVLIITKSDHRQYY